MIIFLLALKAKITCTYINTVLISTKIALTRSLLRQLMSFEAYSVRSAQAVLTPEKGR